MKSNSSAVRSSSPLTNDMCMFIKRVPVWQSIAFEAIDAEARGDRSIGLFMLSMILFVNCFFVQSFW